MISIGFFYMMVVIIVMVVVVIAVMISMSTVVVVAMMMVIVTMSTCSGKATLRETECASRSKQTSLHKHFYLFILGW
jgi:uncharacterized membrane protein